MIGKSKFLIAAILATAMVVATGFSGCASLQTERQKIAVACESVASAADSISVATEQGRLTAAQAGQALAIAKTTIPFCQPPLASLSEVDYARLLAASASLAALAEEASR